MAKLNDRQRQFCREYLIDLNATQAAIRAGYSEKYANTNASKLLQNTTINNYLQELKNERSQRTEITADLVLEELAAIATADITNYVNVTRDHDRDGFLTVEVTETAKLTPKQRKAIASIKQGRNGIEVKLFDKVSTLKLLGDHLGMWLPPIDQVEETESDGFIEALKGEAASVWQDD